MADSPRRYDDDDDDGYVPPAAALEVFKQRIITEMEERRARGDNYPFLLRRIIGNGATHVYDDANFHTVHSYYLYNGGIIHLERDNVDGIEYINLPTFVSNILGNEDYIIKKNLSFVALQKYAITVVFAMNANADKLMRL